MKKKRTLLFFWSITLVLFYAVGMIVQQSYVMHLTRIVQKLEQKENLLNHKLKEMQQEIALLETKESLCAALAPEEFIPLTQNQIVQLT